MGMQYAFACVYLNTGRLCGTLTGTGDTMVARVCRFSAVEGWHTPLFDQGLAEGEGFQGHPLQIARVYVHRTQR